MRRGTSSRIRKIVLGMESGDTLRAIAESQTMALELWTLKPERFLSDGMASAFRSLLRRRGYYVSTPLELAGSLEEIRSIGEGFDLFELARALGEIDTILVDCLALTPNRFLPEVEPFVRRCACGRHAGAERPTSG